MSLEDDILIERFLRNQLSEEELLDFNNRLEKDLDFLEKLKLEEQMFKALDDDQWSYFEDGDHEEVKAYRQTVETNDLQNLKKTLTEIGSDYKTPNTKGSIIKFVYLAAAVIAIFFAVNIFLDKELSNNELYYKYSNYDDLPSFVVRSDSSNLKLVEAQKSFEAKAYGLALKVFEAELENQKTNGDLFVYTGLTQAELGQFRSADSTFSKLMNSNLLGCLQREMV